MRLVSGILLFEVAHLDHFFHGAAPHSDVSGKEWIIGIMQCMIGMCACVLVLGSLKALHPSLLWDFVNPGGEWFMIPIYWLWARTIISLYKAAVHFPHPLDIRKAFKLVFGIVRSSTDVTTCSESLLAIATLMSESMVGQSTTTVSTPQTTTRNTMSASNVPKRGIRQMQYVSNNSRKMYR
jgi:hypothetical protein